MHPTQLKITSHLASKKIRYIKHSLHYILMMKLLIIIFAILLFTPQIALADGGLIVPNIHDKISLPSQKAVIVWDDGEETLILSTKIQPENITDIAWVIPIQSKTKPEVEKGNSTIFFDLARLFQERRQWGILAASKMSAESGGIELIEVKMVDMYYIVILKADDASVLVDWLNDHTFHVPESATEVLEGYVGDDYYFVINRINLPNKLNNPLTDDDYTCAAAINIQYYWDEQDIDYQINYTFHELDQCADANLEAVKLLKQVETGISTPLEITFEPDVPYYPMKMSSINDGVVAIDLYFFGDNYVYDTSGFLQSKGRRKSTDQIKIDYNIDKNLISYMRYVGDLENLNRDSYFRSYTVVDRVLEAFNSFIAMFLSR